MNNRSIDFMPSFSPPTLALVAQRHLSAVLKEKKALREKITYSIIIFAGSALSLILGCSLALLSWLSAGIAPWLQLAIFLLLHSVGAYWILSNKEGLQSSQHPDWENSLPCSGALQRWCATLQLWTLHKYLLLYLLVLTLVASQVAPTTPLPVGEIHLSSLQLSTRFLLASLFFMLGQWMLLLKMPYRYTFCILVGLSSSLFYGNSSIATLSLVIALSGIIFYTERKPNSTASADTLDCYLGLPLTIRCLISGLKATPALLIHPIWLVSLGVLSPLLNTHYRLFWGDSMTWAITVCEGVLMLLLALHARTSWITALRQEGAYLFSLPKGEKRIRQITNPLLLTGIVLACINIAVVAWY